MNKPESKPSTSINDILDAIEHANPAQLRDNLVIITRALQARAHTEQIPFDM